MTNAAFELLLEEFGDGDIDCKRRAALKLDVVAKSLGAEHLKSKLLPWLENRISNKGFSSRKENGSTLSGIDANNLSNLDLNAREDDEILYIFAEKLGDFPSFLHPNTYNSLIPSLTCLCGAEEAFVREKAVASTLKIIQKLSLSQLKAEGGMVSMVSTLAVGEWFTDRVSACEILPSLLLRLAVASLGPDAFGLVNAGRNREIVVSGIPSSVSKEYQLLKEVYVELCKDATPMVKNAAANELGFLAIIWDGKFAFGKAANSVCTDKNRTLGDGLFHVSPRVNEGSNSFKNTLLEGCFGPLTSDTQEYVRISAIAQTAEICSCLGAKDNEKWTLSYVSSFCSDASWRVRYTIVTNFGLIIKAVQSDNKERLSQKLLSLYLEMLQDPQMEVRLQAAKELVCIFNSIESSRFVGSVLPVVKSLVCTETQIAVLLCLAEASVNASIVHKVSSLGGAKENLLPIWEQILNSKIPKETESDMTSRSMIQAKVLKKLDLIADTLGSPFVMKEWGALLQQIYKDSKASFSIEGEKEMVHPQWRLRQAILSSLDILAQPDYLHLIVELWEMGIRDDVFQVRLTAANLVAKFCSNSCAVGLPTVMNDLIPVLNRFHDEASNADSPNYLRRMTYLHAASSLSYYPEAWDLVRSRFESAFRDPIPNVRLKACRLLITLDETVLPGLLPLAMELSEENDPDIVSALSNLRHK